MSETHNKNQEYTNEELINIQELINLLDKIDQELKEEGIPVEEYEAWLNSNEILIN
jgi:hypothetical protein